MIVRDIASQRSHNTMEVAGLAAENIVENEALVKVKAMAEVIEINMAGIMRLIIQISGSTRVRLGLNFGIMHMPNMVHYLTSKRRN